MIALQTESLRLLAHADVWTYAFFLPQVPLAGGRSSPKSIKKCVHMKQVKSKESAQMYTPEGRYGEKTAETFGHRKVRVADSEPSGTAGTSPMPPSIGQLEQRQ